MKKITLILCCLAFNLPTHAALMVYEGFDYNADSLLRARNGGTGFGTNAWIDPSLVSENDDVINSGGLSYGALQTTGNSALLLAPSDSGSTDGRNLPTNAISISSGSTWVSFLVRLNTPTVTSSENAWLSVRAGSGFSGPAFGIFQKEGQATFGIGSTLSSDTPTFSNITFSAQTTYLIVAEILWNSSGSNETINLYVNPTIGGVSPGTSVATRTDFNIATDAGTNRITRIDISGSAEDTQWIFDEIRIGSTFADVTPVPEPGSLLLATFGAGLFWLRLRRRA